MAKKKDTTPSLRKDELQKQLKNKNAALKKLKRELKIEAALERVRARSMSMYNSQELQEVINTICDRLQLEIKMDSVNFDIFKEGQRSFDGWVSSSNQKYSTGGEIKVETIEGEGTMFIIQISMIA